MPKPANPHCPQCKSDRTIKHTRTKAGSQRYRCKACKKTFTPRKKPGRPTVGDRPLTQTEIQQRYYDGLSAEDKKAYNKKRNAWRKKKD